MQTINSSKLILCDIDETLVSTTNWGEAPEGCRFILFNNIMFFVHTRHITLLQEFKARGFTIILWSAGGSDWARMVAESLYLNHCVDFIMDKPSWYIDDKTSENFMGERIFLDLKDKTKDIR